MYENMYTYGFDSRYVLMRLLKNHALLRLVNNMLIDLPEPSNLTYL